MSYNYNPSSQKAEEFINHEEILETLSYAEKNKNNELITRFWRPRGFRCAEPPRGGSAS